jgi:hypothetical protein
MEWAIPRRIEIRERCPFLREIIETIRSLFSERNFNGNPSPGYLLPPGQSLHSVIIEKNQLAENTILLAGFIEGNAKSLKSNLEKGFAADIYLSEESFSPNLLFLGGQAIL